MSEELKPCPFCGWKKVTIAGKKVIRGYLWDRGVNKHIFLKIEQRCAESIDVFLEKEDKAGIIDYSKSCTLPYGGNISGLFNEFGQHPKIERALISLLELH